MRFKGIMHMALAFLAMDTQAKETMSKTGSFKESLKGTDFRNVNVGESPIYFPNKKQQIKRKRFLAKKK